LPTLQNISDSSANSTANLTNIHWATYWAEAVNSQSKHQKEAWKFLEFLASKESLEKCILPPHKPAVLEKYIPALVWTEKLVAIPSSNPSWILLTTLNPVI